MNAILDTPSGSPDTQTAATGQPPRTLVVDDDMEILGLEAKILEGVGHRVETAANGEAALQALQNGDYDLLVTDYMMPGVSGLALVRQLRVASLKLPVVMVSGALENLDTAKLTRDPGSRIDGFVRKPFTIPELLSAVRRALTSNGVGTVSGRLRSH